MEEEFRKGQSVVFFNGRSPRRGQIKEKLDDDQYIVVVKSNGSYLEIVKPGNELKAFEAVRGQKTRIRFL